MQRWHYILIIKESQIFTRIFSCILRIYVFFYCNNKFCLHGKKYFIIMNAMGKGKRGPPFLYFIKLFCDKIE